MKDAIMSEKNEDGKNFSRITKGKNKDEVAKKWAKFNEKLQELGFDSHSKLPETKEEGKAMIDTYSSPPKEAFYDQSISGSRLSVSDDYEIWSLFTTTNEEYNEEGEVLEADIIPEILAEDKKGYGLWCEEPVEINADGTEDRRIDTKNDIYFVSSDENGIQFIGSPIESDKAEMHLNYEEAPRKIRENKGVVEERLQENLQAVEKAEYRNDTGAAFAVEVGLEGTLEELEERIETAYIAAREAAVTRDFR